METVRASELRLNNIVQDEHGIIQYVYRIWQNGAELVEEQDGDNDLDYPEDEIFPVKLTEEWLLKFGFEKKLNCSNMIYYILAGKCLLEYNLTHNIADIVRKVHLDLFIDIKYVHQLQNLYFALTGEELLLSLPQ